MGTMTLTMTPQQLDTASDVGHSFDAYAPWQVRRNSWDGSHTGSHPERDMLDAVIISDLHLGSDNCQAKSLTRLLERLLAGAEGDMSDEAIRARKLIINGDVFDSIDFRRLKKNHWRVLSEIRHLSDKMEVIWIAGNHDGPAEIISHLVGVTVVEQYILQTGNKKVLCVHGDMFDEFIDEHPFITRLADFGYALLQKLDRSHYIARLAKKRSKTFLHCLEKIEKGSRKRARELGCQMATCGHTHFAVSREEGDVWYYNSGCWTENPCHYITVDNGAMKLCQWHEEVPQEAAEPMTVDLPETGQTPALA